jgi:hypothetical protein
MASMAANLHTPSGSRGAEWRYSVWLSNWLAVSEFDDSFWRADLGNYGDGDKPWFHMTQMLKQTSTLFFVTSSTLFHLQTQ